MAVFTMPSLGADMEAGKLVEWLVGPGDKVSRGDVIAVVETQKGAIEIEVFEDGVIEALDAEIGQTLPVGAPLARIAGTSPGPVSAPSGPTPSASRPEPVAPAPEPVAQIAPGPVRSAPMPGARGIAASPAARAKAAAQGIDLSSLSGSGPGGAIVLADVEARRARQPETPQAAAPAGDRAAALAAMRRAIAAAMARSKRTIPHYYVSHRVDLGPASDWLDTRNAAATPEARVLMGALLARATALAAKAIPAFNGHYSDGGFAPSDRVHLGLAVALRGGGLVAPAILDADLLGLPQLMEAMRDVTSRARAGRLKSSEMSMATLTFSALGETGVEQMSGVIVPPQVAIVTAGSPAPAAVVRDGAVVARPTVTLTLAADHRVSDGRLGARLLTEIDRLLQTPETL